MRKYILLIILALFASVFNVYADEESIMYTEKAVILEVENSKDVNFENNGQDIQYVKLKIMSGKYKNKVMDTINNLSGNPAYDIKVKENDKVVVVIEEESDGYINAYISEYLRQDYILYLSIMFILFILVVGKQKGIKSVITLTITLFAVLKILLPLILKGFNPILTTICVSIGITGITLFIISGINTKSISAIIGTTGGVLTSGLLAYYVGSKIKLTGLNSEEAIMLSTIGDSINLDFKSLLFAGIIMGALGAVMDVGMSIASSIEEIHKANPSLSKKELFASGMNVGRDIMGTMTNTLILAYTGSSIPLLLLFMYHEPSIVKILNLDIIATEVVRSLSGSIGLIIAIPLTALVSSMLIKNKKE
ncbi:YibE/F family protein [Tepidibacter hydrothermalis]|uniref:YibE/F family protein n=1 Tax=Tepidibacter hydrothermalis TaxID=3036126 RepID=A0ABY8EGD8_9FIRM|nr:YibE/F family protein [Tepidibacter hydrothermalis]WFD10829.1 YibE/F family protein [Tepidibacter hydrothermalis]